MGKLFTSTLISILFERGMLSYNDRVATLLDHDLVDDLHVLNGVDRSGDIEIRHLLNHTSGLDDHFYPLLEKCLKNPDCDVTPREVIEWSKTNLRPRRPPGAGFHYSDTNYHLLGLVVEGITGMYFHDALEYYIFKPLRMHHSHMLHYSEPMEESHHPVADFHIRDIRLNDYHCYSGIDFAGGGIVATAEDQLRFMISVVNGQIISNDTFERMRDWARYSMVIDYGYGLMRFRTIPLLVPAKYSIWGHAGATGSFMFYQPELGAYLIGSFNRLGYERRAVRMMFKVISRLWKVRKAGYNSFASSGLIS